MNPSGAFSFLIQTLFDFYAWIVLARLILQFARADFYNPVSQFVVKATNPLLLPMRRLIPAVGPVDTSSLLLYLLVITAKLILLGLVNFGGMLPLGLLAQAVPFGALSLLFSFYFGSILLEVIMSWVGDPYHPFAQILRQINEPIMGPIRKAIPSLGGLDISPMIALLLLGMLQRLFGL